MMKVGKAGEFVDHWRDDHTMQALHTHALALEVWMKLTTTTKPKQPPQNFAEYNRLSSNGTKLEAA